MVTGSTDSPNFLDDYDKLNFFIYISVFVFILEEDDWI